MNIITNSIETDERIAQLFIGWVVSISLDDDDRRFEPVAITVLGTERAEGFAAIIGTEFDEDNPTTPGAHRSFLIHEIDTLEVH